MPLVRSKYMNDLTDIVPRFAPPWGLLTTLGMIVMVILLILFTIAK